MKQNPITKDLTVIIRHCGERTTQACYDLLARQVPEEQIFMVSDTPFSATLRKSLETGLEQGRKWTLCVDADVLVDQQGVRNLIEQAEQELPEVAEVQGLCIDKFFFGHKAAGNHLYRTAHLEKAMACIPEEGESLRPETEMLDRLSEAGYPWKQPDITVGLHDFEQYYRDIFARKYLQSFKHEHKLSSFVREYRRFSESDFDYLVALWGLAAGMMSGGKGKADYASVPFDFFDHCASETGNFKEKTELASDSVEPSYIIEDYRNKIEHGTITPLMKNLFRKPPEQVSEPERTEQHNAGHIFSEKGLLKGSLWCVGSVLSKSGKLLQDGKG